MATNYSKNNVRPAIPRPITKQPSNVAGLYNHHQNPAIQTSVEAFQSPPVKPDIPVTISYNLTYAVAYGPKSQRLICPFCHFSIKTTVENETTTRTHMTAQLINLSCGWFCCFCCCPYCKDSFRNQNHYCPNCKAYLGTHER